MATSTSPTSSEPAPQSKPQLRYGPAPARINELGGAAPARGVLPLNPAEGPTPNFRLVTVPMNSIFQPSPVQTRAAFAPEQNEEDQALLNSLKQHGQLTPVTLEALKDKKPPEHRIIDGHRRIAALRLLNILTVLAIVRPEGEQLKADLDTLTANIRQNLAPSQLARQLVLIRDRHHLTWEQIADAAGLTRQHVHNLVKFTQLPQAMQDQVEQKRLSLKAALALGQASAEQQPALAQLAVQNDLSEADAKRAVALTQAGRTPEQIATELGLEPAKETTPESKETAAVDVPTPRRKTAVGRRPNKTMSAQASSTLLKTYFPTAPAREIEAIAQEMADQPLTSKRLKLIGLLRIGGVNEKQLPANIETLPGSREMLNLLEAAIAIRRAAAQEKCAPEFLASLRLIARSLPTLKPAKKK